MKFKTTLALAICSLMLTVASRAGVGVPFKARFQGIAESPTGTADPNVIQIVVPLHGVGTHLGQFDEHLVHFLNTKTFTFTGYADWTAANGDTFRTIFAGQLYPTADPAVVTFEVTHTIVSGTGRFSHATGTFHGVDGRFNFATNEDQGGYEGAISY